jgi:hypothetical protein
MAGSLVYPRLLFRDSVRIAYYSDDANQNIIIFQGDYDSADIIDITHGTLSHIRPVYDIIRENGAMRINSITLTGYRRRHVQMIRRYMMYSDINRVYIPEPLDNYDVDVFNMLFYLSIRPDGNKNFELVKYSGALMPGEVLVAVNNFEHERTPHRIIEMSVNREAGNLRVIRRLLYLGIGYQEGYEKHTDISSRRYDIVFYGTHRYNRREDIFTSDIYGTYAGILSTYRGTDGGRQFQRLGENALSAYSSDSILFISDSYRTVIFDIRKDGSIKNYLK